MDMFPVVLLPNSDRYGKYPKVMAALGDSAEQIRHKPEPLDIDEMVYLKGEDYEGSWEQSAVGHSKRQGYRLAPMERQGRQGYLEGDRQGARQEGSGDDDRPDYFPFERHNRRERGHKVAQCGKDEGPMRGHTEARRVFIAPKSACADVDVCAVEELWDVFVVVVGGVSVVLSEEPGARTDQNLETLDLRAMCIDPTSGCALRGEQRRTGCQKHVSLHDPGTQAGRIHRHTHEARCQNVRKLHDSVRRFVAPVAAALRAGDGGNRCRARERRVAKPVLRGPPLKKNWRSTGPRRPQAQHGACQQRRSPWGFGADLL